MRLQISTEPNSDMKNTIKIIPSPYHPLLDKRYPSKDHCLIQIDVREIHYKPMWHSKQPNNRSFFSGKPISSSVLIHGSITRVTWLCFHDEVFPVESTFRHEISFRNNKLSFSEQKLFCCVFYCGNKSIFCLGHLFSQER